MAGAGNQSGPGEYPPSTGASTSDALIRQSDTLERHEAKIARHTAIQSWTNIISVITSVIMTAALIGIAILQWQASEREVALQYAQAMPHYLIDVTYADGRKFGLSSVAGWADEAADTSIFSPTKTITISQNGGTSTLDYIAFRQIYGLHDEKTKSFCEFELRDAFVSQDGKTFVDALSDRFPNTTTLTALPAARGGNPVWVDWRRTEIYTRYMNVFGDTKYDRIVVGEEGSRTERDVGDPSFVSEFSVYELDGKMYVIDTHGEPPKACGPSVMGSEGGR